MTPLHLWALYGAAGGVALPVVIHLLTRPRGVRLPLPGFRFLLESANQTARRNRLRALLILLARACAVALAALGFARLAERAAASATAGHGERQGQVVILDCSLSMRADSDGAPVFDRARAIAQKELAKDGVAVADLVLAAQGARAVFGKLSANLTALRDEIAQARALPQALDATAAIDAAAHSLAGISEDELKRHEVVIISDLQRSNWAKASFGRLPKGVPVRMVTVQSSQANVAILKAGISGMAESGAPMIAFAEIANYGTAPAGVNVELIFDGRTWKRRLVLAPGAVESVPFEMNGTPAGWRNGYIQVTCDSMAQDVLRDDNRFPICVNVHSAREVALLTAERAGENGPAYFLEQGLWASPDASVHVTRYLPAQLEGELDESLWRANLVAVINCGRLSEAQSASLGRLISSGLPVLYVTQFSADADNLKALQAALGSALRLPVEFQASRSAGPTEGGSLSAILGSGRGGLNADGKRFLVSVNTERRPFKVFGDAITRFTQGMFLSGGLASSAHSDAGIDAESILASYSDGSAALLVTRVAAGRLALLNMLLGGSGRTLAAYPLFVPLIQELCVDLLEGGSERNSNGVCGLSFTMPIPRWAASGGTGSNIAASGTQGWRLETAGGQAVPLDAPDAPDAPVVRSDAGGTTLLWNVAGEPGAYLVKRGDLTVAGFTLTPPFTEESNLAALDPEVLTQRLARDRTVAVVDARQLDDASQPKRETTGLFFLGALGLLFMELALLKVFRT